jgi:CBS domain containing-hemolysin-like protein
MKMTKDFDDYVAEWLIILVASILGGFVMMSVVEAVWLGKFQSLIIAGSTLVCSLVAAIIILVPPWIYYKIVQRNKRRKDLK